MTQRHFAARASGAPHTPEGLRQRPPTRRATLLRAATRRTLICTLLASVALLASANAQAQASEPGPPVLEGSESFEKVGSVDAEVSGEFDPVGLAGKSAASTYYFEYGTSTAYGFETPETSVAEESGSVAARARLTGLQPDTEYHFRLVATDQYGTTRGADVSFTTFAAIGSGLPDGRIDEMVSSPEDDNADIYAPELNVSAAIDGAYFAGVPGIEVSSSDGGGNCCSEVGTPRPFLASADGDAVTFVGDASTGGNGNVGNNAGNQYLAVRTASGWEAQDITPAVDEAQYWGFSPDLSVGFVTSGGVPGEEPLSPEAPSGNVLYTRTSSDGSYHALAAMSRYEGSSADGSDLLVEGGVNRSEGEIVGGSRELDEWVEGRPVPVNVLPGGAPAPEASFGSFYFYNEFNGENSDVSHAISADGSRVFWTDMATHQLFVREDGTSTVQVDASKVSGGEGGGGEFWTASGDGSKVFFTDCKRLTANSTAQFSSGCEEPGVEVESNTTHRVERWEPSGADLFEYDVPTGELTDLTVDQAEPADVQAVIGASEDGEYVYFVADGVLAEGATAGQPNLYLRHAGETKLIATLSQADDGQQGGTGGSAVFGDWQPLVGRRTAEVALDGQAIAFDSTEGLTAGDPKGIDEVYVYEVQSGTLFCASCEPSGEPPSAESTLPSGGSAEDPTYMRRFLSEDGTRVFFDSNAALDPHDTNGVADVYEWERDGTGSCQDSRGCVYLLSGGTSPQASWFLDASSDGDDVFFVTRAQLAPQDGNEDMDVYDAHAGGVPPQVEPECSGTGCQGVPLAPTAFEAPSSTTFSGLGNFPVPSGSTAKRPVRKKTVKRNKRHKRRKKDRKDGKARRAGRARKSAERAQHVRGKRGRS
jgi:hypothetical protein